MGIDLAEVLGAEVVVTEADNVLGKQVIVIRHVDGHPLARRPWRGAVRAVVRQTFGDEALTRLGRRRPHRPWRLWRRPIRRCTSLLAGTTSVAPRLKEALERARHDAHRRQRSAIDPAALLHGMVEVDDAMANRLLREAGHDPCAIRRALR